MPAHVDGRMPGITEKAGGRIVIPDRMGHHTEGLRNYDPIWRGHGIRVLPGCGSRRRPPGARWDKETP